MEYLITKWFGTFLCGKGGIKKKILFPQDAKEIAKRLQKIDKNDLLSEEKTIIKNNKVRVSEKRLQTIGDFSPGDPFFTRTEIQPETFGFSQELLHEASLRMATNKVEKTLKAADLQVVQLVNALDDLLQTSNLLSERLDHWSLIPTPKEKIQPFEHTFQTVTKEMKRLERQIEADMVVLAPNICKITGPLIGARLISLAGGIERLAAMPASTIQLLGAEKALFRFKKEGGKPPKHGVIFQHSLIHQSPRTTRGKIARLLAAKIAIAAKADVFTKRDVGDRLREDLEKRVKEIRNQ